MNQHPASIILVGRPNVGKSTLFNRLIGRREAIEHDSANTTRDLVRSLLYFGNKSVELIDTAGDINKTTDILVNMSYQKKAEVLPKVALILFVFDAIEGITAEDERILRDIRKLNKPFLFIANKADNEAIVTSVKQEFKFEVEKLISVSAIHNLGVLKIIEKLEKYAKSYDEPQRFEVALLGKPNAGKSTLANAIANSDVSIVSDIAGTTRDLIKIDVGPQNNLLLIDTAGIARRAKSMKGLSRYSTIRVEEMIKNVDCVLLVVDIIEGVAAQDLKLASLAIENGSALILVLNKLDRIEDEKKEEFIDKHLQLLMRKFTFAPFIPAVFVSALNKTNIEPLLEQIEKIKKNRVKIVNQNDLVEFLHKLKGEHQAYSVIKSILQDGVNPPQFVLKTNNKLSRHHLKHIINSLRLQFKIESTPIQIILKERQVLHKHESVRSVIA